MSRLFLQTALFREYLNYSEQSLEAVPATEMHMALVQHSHEVAHGYKAALDFVQLFGKLLILIYYTLHNSKDGKEIMFVVMMPVLMIAFAAIRSKIMSET